MTRAVQIALCCLISVSFCGPTLAQFYPEQKDEYGGVLNPSNFSQEYYFEQMKRFPDRIGIICYNAYLVEKAGRHEDGFHFYNECAQRGNSAAMFNLSLFYERGAGVERNLEQARYWLKRAAQAGFSPAQFQLGMALKKESANQEQLAEANHWINAAAAQGESNAVAYLNRR